MTAGPSQPLLTTGWEADGAAGGPPVSAEFQGFPRAGLLLCPPSTPNSAPGKKHGGHLGVLLLPPLGPPTTNPLGSSFSEDSRTSEEPALWGRTHTTHVYAHLRTLTCTHAHSALPPGGLQRALAGFSSPGLGWESAWAGPVVPARPLTKVLDSQVLKPRRHEGSMCPKSHSRGHGMTQVLEASPLSPPAPCGHAPCPGDSGPSHHDAAGPECPAAAPCVSPDLGPVRHLLMGTDPPPSASAVHSAGSQLSRPTPLAPTSLESLRTAGQLQRDSVPPTPSTSAALSHSAEDLSA